MKINYLSGPFKRFYNQNWSHEYFTIASRHIRDNIIIIPIYTRIDYGNDINIRDVQRKLQRYT